MEMSLLLPAERKEFRVGPEIHHAITDRGGRIALIAEAHLGQEFEFARRGDDEDDALLRCAVQPAVDADRRAVEA